MGRRPSGTRATVTPMAKRKPSLAGSPKSRETPKKLRPTPTARKATTRTTRASSPASGLGGRSTPAVRAAIPARRVAPPVACTRPTPSPVTTKVPAKRSSPSARRVGRLSPVSIDSSMRRSWPSTTARSAATRSPGVSSTTSPTTRSAASITSTLPSRRTVTRTGMRSPRRSAAFSARSSWTKANTPLMTTTMKMATPSWGRPATKASSPATQSMRAKKWTISPTRRFQGAWRSGGGSRLGPSAVRRAATSARLSPGSGALITASAEAQRHLVEVDHPAVLCALLEDLEGPGPGGGGGHVEGEVAPGAGAGAWPW